MSISKSLFSALIASFLLVMIAGSAFTGFQGWVSLQTSAQNKSSAPIFISSSLRIAPTPVSVHVVKTSQTVVETLGAVKNSTVELIAPPQVALKSENVQPVESNPIISPMDNISRPADVKTAPHSNVHLEPSIVVYDNEIAVEFPRAIADFKTIKKSLARLILSPEPFSEPLMSSASLSFKKTPYFYKKVIDQKGRAIRYPANALAYIDALIKTDALEEVKDAEGEFTVVRIPLTQPRYPKPIERYKGWVESYAKEFSVSPSLIFAIMETESGFRPEAVSKSNAMGLMQLKAEAAGRDVFAQVDKKMGQPNQGQLFDEQENIRMGTAYLGLLKHDYFGLIRNPKNKELVTIASYNGGLSTVLKLFGNTHELALAQINRLHPRQVYRKLRFEHQSKETREYLDKVLQAKNRYQSILDA
ncbi:MAG: DUF3393 domain-containing protein [Thiotrichales bacterium]|nr:DUF3393 domain-containing protein [Thiotrichales bacterium]